MRPNSRVKVVVADGEGGCGRLMLPGVKETNAMKALVSVSIYAETKQLLLLLIAVTKTNIEGEYLQLNCSLINRYVPVGQDVFNSQSDSFICIHPFCGETGDHSSRRRRLNRMSFYCSFLFYFKFCYQVCFIFLLFSCSFMPLWYGRDICQCPS